MYQALISIIVMMTWANLSSSYHHYSIYGKQAEKVCKVDFASDEVLDKYFKCRNSDEEHNKKLDNEMNNAYKLCMDKFYDVVSNYTKVKKEQGKKAIIMSCFAHSLYDCIHENIPEYNKYHENEDKNYKTIKKCQADALGVENDDEYHYDNADEGETA